MHSSKFTMILNEPTIHGYMHLNGKNDLKVYKKGKLGYA
jgi:hypothetical protein